MGYSMFCMVPLKWGIVFSRFAETERERETDADSEREKESERYKESSGEGESDMASRMRTSCGEKVVVRRRAGIRHTPRCTSVLHRRTHLLLALHRRLAQLLSHSALGTIMSSPSSDLEHMASPERCPSDADSSEIYAFEYVLRRSQTRSLH